MRSRVALGVALLLLLILGWWVWRQISAPPPPPPVATPTPADAPLGTPTPTPLEAPPGYRLAGVALGGPDAFAVIEAPGGANTLYRLQAEIPGLGRLVRIEAERVVVRAEGREIDLWLTPALTPTPTRTLMAPALTPARLGTPPAGRSTGGSMPSGAPDRPAS